MKLAEILDSHVIGDEYQILCKMPGHRTFRERHREHMTLAEVLCRDRTPRLPPELTEENLTVIFAELRQQNPLMPEVEAKVALHPNATAGLVKAACKSAETVNAIMDLVAKSDSPHAEWFMKCQNMECHLGSLRHATPDGLYIAAHEMKANNAKSLSDILTHPNYPWRKDESNDGGGSFDNDSILAAVHREHMSDIIAARFLFGASKSKVLPNELTGKFPGCLLFVENLSAVKLEKMVAAYPEQAALAACHPNGGDIHVTNEHDRKIVDQFRAKFAAPTFALRGKSDGKQSADLQQMIEL